MHRKVQEGPGEKIVAQMVWFNGRIFDGLSGTMMDSGSLVIDPGAFADLFAVDGNPLEDISCLVGQGESLSLIMKSGEIFKSALV